MTGWLRNWIRAQVRDLVASEVRRIRVFHEDPIGVFESQREVLRDELRAAANEVGSNVIIGRDLVLWGGKFPGGVGLRIHDGVRIYDGCRLVIDHSGPDSGIVLHESVALNFSCYLDGSGGLSIGKRTIVGPNTVIVSSGHRVDLDVPVQSSGKIFQPVAIGDDVWLGANVVVRMGVTIGNRAVVGAGAVVTRDVPPDAIVAGNPAQLVRTKS